jgi:hypothetical protein
MKEGMKETKEFGQDSDKSSCAMARKEPIASTYAPYHLTLMGMSLSSIQPCLFLLVLPSTPLLCPHLPP